jgi:hypothetical protein
MPLGANATLVVAISIGYSLKSYNVFVGSLRSHYNGPVLLLTNGSCKEVHHYCRRNRVRLVSGSAARRYELNDSSKMSIMVSRFLAYDHACADYSFCFASDFRDIYFAANPFASFASFERASPNLLVVPMEHHRAHADGHAFGRSPINRNALHACFAECRATEPNADACADVESKMVLNDGALHGSPSAFAALAVLFREHMHRLNQWSRARFWVQCSDQALFNYFVHRRLGALRSISIEMQPRGHGVVHTLYEVTQRPWTLADVLREDGVVTNFDRSVSAVVHMYDRLPTRYLRNLSAWRQFRLKEAPVPCAAPVPVRERMSYLQKNVRIRK